MQSYSNYAYMHGYYNIFAFMHNFTPTDMRIFYFYFYMYIKMCKVNYFLYFARFCNY